MDNGSITHSDSVSVIPMSIVIATRDRWRSLAATLASLSGQDAQPEEIIIVDGSSHFRSFDACIPKRLHSRIVYMQAEKAGAAWQRNEGFLRCRHQMIGFMDDDIVLEHDCLSRMVAALFSDHRVGGVSAMIINQRYRRPGLATRCVLALMSGEHRSSYAGCLIGPAINILPDSDEGLPPNVRVEWLNTTCVLYRREALPLPPFPTHFHGYSIMEDVALSATVGRQWKLLNARCARIRHDSQPGLYKSNTRDLSRMLLVNRHYIMTEVLGRSGFADYLKLVVWEFWQMAIFAVQQPIRTGDAVMARVEAMVEICRTKRSGTL